LGFGANGFKVGLTALGGGFKPAEAILFSIFGFNFENPTFKLGLRNLLTFNTNILYKMIIGSELK
jgi:hypothetical protein